jgi:hypothetical protein
MTQIRYVRKKRFGSIARQTICEGFSFAAAINARFLSRDLFRIQLQVVGVYMMFDNVVVDKVGCALTCKGRIQVKGSLLHGRVEAALIFGTRMLSQNYLMKEIVQ